MPATYISPAASIKLCMRLFAALIAVAVGVEPVVVVVSEVLLLSGVKLLLESVVVPAISGFDVEESSKAPAKGF